MALELRLTGGATNVLFYNSTGGVMSSSSISTSRPMNNLFFNVLPSVTSTGCTHYRALDIYNSGTATATNVSMYVTNSISTMSLLSIGEELGVNPHATSATLLLTSSDTSIPAISFSFATITFSDIPAGQAARFWVQREIHAGIEPISNDTHQIVIAYT